MSDDDAITKRATTAARTAGYRPLHDEEPVKSSNLVIEETIQERAARQRQARRAELTYSQGDYERWDENRERVLAERQAGTFMLGWMQSPVTQSQDELWASLYTPETKEEQKQFILSCNAHLNEPVRQGEIVVLPSSEPKTPEEHSQLEQLIEQAKVASLELAKLLNEEVVTLNRHFELLSHQLMERVSKDGLPQDYYAQVSIGVGATATGIQQNLTNIQNVMLEINDLYTSQVAMASRTGGVNYSTFTAERAALFKKLDGSFARLSSRSVQLPIYKQVKRNLNLSTKSVIHNADEILKKGVVKDLGKRIANISIGISASRGLGYIGLAVGAVSGVDSIYEACKVDGKGECGKTTAREVAGFIGSWQGGVAGGVAGSSLAVAAVSGIALVIGVTAAAPVLAVAAIGGAILGGGFGGIVGSTGGKAAVDGLYFLYESSDDILADIEAAF